MTQHCNETLIRLPIYPQLAECAEEIAERVASIAAADIYALAGG